MDKYIKNIARDIKSLKIQGARKVALGVINALIYTAKNSKSKDIKQFYKEFFEVAEYLYKLRPTEPMTRNTIDRILNYIHLLIKNKSYLKQTSRRKRVDQVRELIVKKGKQMIKQMKINRERIAKYGSQLIQNNMTIMTYCHSSTVTNLLKHARIEGKSIEVISCETRPRFQGRITAKELASYKIPVTQIVDGAMNAFMKDVDMVIVGGDAVTSRGDLINKIGTSTLAHIARAHDIPFYSAVELFKFDPLTLFGFKEKIEERDKKEVWEKPPRGVKIRNPAFDLTYAKYISGYITEEGIIPPQSLLSVVKQTYHLFK